MASPWISPQQQRPPIERPWMGMALLVAVPLLALVLIRMLWSGSALWFLTVGIILLGAAAVIFLARRSQEQDYAQPISAPNAPESNRVPLILTGLGVLFLAMLLVPNFADGGGSSSPTATNQERSDVAAATQAPVQQQPQVQAQPTAVPQQAAAREEQPISETSSINTTSETDHTAATGETYVVADGDTLWDIADRYDTTVEAIVEANSLDNPADIQIGDELVIPAADDNATGDTTGGGDEGAAQ